MKRAGCPGAGWAARTGAPTATPAIHRSGLSGHAVQPGFTGLDETVTLKQLACHGSQLFPVSVAAAKRSVRSAAV